MPNTKWITIIIRFGREIEYRFKSLLIYLRLISILLQIILELRGNFLVSNDNENTSEIIEGWLVKLTLLMSFL
jgi:hypothetical protein